MASSPLRRLLEDRVSQLLADGDRLAMEACQRAARDCADRLNQAVRRIRQAETIDEIAATLADTGSDFAAGAAVFEIRDQSAHLKAIRGGGLDAAPAQLEVPLALAPALAGAIQTRDPVAAAAVPGEVSPLLVDLLGHEPDRRVSILPISAGERVPGILYAWGKVEESALELLAQVAAVVWPAASAAAPAAALPAAAAPPLVQIGVAAPPPVSWEALPRDEQETHLRAQRFARVQVAQIRLFEPDAVQSGRSRRTLYDALRKPIDAARAAFRDKFFAHCPSMLDYLHLELVRTLANENAELLGPDYPGPMV